MRRAITDTMRAWQLCSGFAAFVLEVYGVGRRRLLGFQLAGVMGVSVHTLLRDRVLRNS